MALLAGLKTLTDADRRRPRNRKESDRRYREVHREQRRAYDRQDSIKEKKRLTHAEIRTLAEKKIAEACGDPSPRCRLDLTPGAETFGLALSSVPCAGPLQIDHVSGGGREEKHRGTGLYRKILRGEKPTDGLRLLCWVHNQLYRAPRSQARSPYGSVRKGERGAH